MNQPTSRRHFLQTASAVGAGFSLLSSTGSVAWAAAAIAKGAPHAEKLGWRLGCQAYSFNRFTFYEAIDKTASVGLKYIEAYPGQKLSREQARAKIDPSLPAELRKQVRQKLADAGVKLVNFGVCSLSKNEKACRQTFEFAKDMGIETLVSEPEEAAFEMLDKLCDEYNLRIAIHNHPRPSHYWDPERVLKVCQGRSKRIGACADTGHWMRSGLDPIECLKKLEGRIVSFHFKDLDRMGGGHDVPWGTGKGNAKGMLAEIRRQGIKAVFSIEYEHNWANSLPEIAQCVEFFDKTAAELAS